MQTDLRFGEKQTFAIKVGAEILFNLSKGIYSNPGNALKELVNNAFDAEATQVIIRARPEFNEITITDNGSGMNSDEFRNRFGWISRTDKRDQGLYSPNMNRPLIGLIGIGFISVLMICNKMTVISKKKNEPYKFEAHLDFEKFKTEKAKKADFYELSTVEYFNCDAKDEIEDNYTMVVLSDISPDFRELLENKDLEELEITELGDVSFEKVIDKIESQIGEGKLEDLEKARGKKAIGEYWRLLLQIANTVPVEYLADGPIKNVRREIIEDIKEQVRDFKFRVDFDGLFLKKPIRFPNMPDVTKEEFDVYTFREMFDFPDGSKLKFRGYIYNQRKSILPSQFRGIIIRVKNVSIGGFLPDFLNYPYSEKLFLPWTSGEIYVDEGLEDAMNIDRNSFMITHPHYRKLKNFLHNFLHKTVFTKARQRYIQRIVIREEERIEAKNIKYNEFLRSELKRKISLVHSSRFDPELPVELNYDENQIIVNDFHPIFNRRKKEREVLEDVMIRFEVAYSQSKGDPERLRRIFYNYLKDL